MKGNRDIQTVTEFLEISYDEWLRRAREILHAPDSPLSFNNGTWKIKNRPELWSQLGSRILDQDLDRFKYLAIAVLRQRNPAFELSSEERYAGSTHDKALEYSSVLRKGIAEGLAILGSQPEVCSTCSQGKVEETCMLVIRELLNDADWVIWASLNRLLPTLAESAPGEFLTAVENTLEEKPCPFYELFSQEGGPIFGENYLAGLLNALESLAWDDEFLIRVCVVLGNLADHDPGGQWANRPANSLTTIMLPWMPQTLASVNKRKAAIKTLHKEWPNIAWSLIIQLLPNQQSVSFGTHKPKWRMQIPDDWGKEKIDDDYWEQVEYYANFAVNIAGCDIARLSELIDIFDNLPTDAFNHLIEILSSKPIVELPEEQKQILWNHLTKLINKHRRFPDAKWVLPETLIERIEKVAEPISPSDSFYLYRHLFTDNDIDLYEGDDDFVLEEKKLDTRRDNAIKEILENKGIKEVFRFAKSVTSPGQVGYALGAIEYDEIERILFPQFLNTKKVKYKELTTRFIWRRHQNRGWEWIDTINKSEWTSSQIGFFLTCLPFNRETWNRVSKWLEERQNEYWVHTGITPLPRNGDLEFAVEKLVEYGRPKAAIHCLHWMLRVNQTIDAEKCIRSLKNAVSSSEPIHVVEKYHIVNLIKYLQSEATVAERDLYEIEWAYLSFLDGYKDAEPKFLENRLANDPEFFCEVIRQIYRSNKEDHEQKKSGSASVAIATKSWQLLNKWKTPPGTQEDGLFCEDIFNSWLKHVVSLCSESGHLEVALITIGEVLIHSPPDPSGLWIHHAIANALNNSEFDDMRSGFKTGKFNSRGVFTVDPTGKPEKKLADKYRRKAEEVELDGFQRLAATLKELAHEYDRMAERFVSKHK